MSNDGLPFFNESKHEATSPTGDESPATRHGGRFRLFRRWRRSRPFWGGFWSILGGLEIAGLPLTAYRIILVSRSVVLAAVVGAVIAILGLLMWMTPSQSKLYGLLVVLLAVVSFVTSNAGGFLLGGLLSIVGGALGFAWILVPVEDGPAKDGGSEAIRA